MKIPFILLLSLILTSITVQSQEQLDSISKKSNLILFAEANFGYSYFSKDAFHGGLSLNFQKGKDLFTFRFLQNDHVEKIEWFLIFPISEQRERYNEFSLLYGKRYIKEGHAFHFSGGVSYNTLENVNGNLVSKSSFFGFPIGVGIHWFPSEKERFRLFGLIPVGKPTRFARSTGFKLNANIAKTSYVGVALTLGLGFHKN